MYNCVYMIDCVCATIYLLRLLGVGPLNYIYLYVYIVLLMRAACHMWRACAWDMEKKKCRSPKLITYSTNIYVVLINNLFVDSILLPLSIIVTLMWLCGMRTYLDCKCRYYLHSGALFIINVKENIFAWH